MTAIDTATMTGTATAAGTATATATATVTPTVDSGAPHICPTIPGWTCADIGSPARQGSESLANGVWRVIGGGKDIWRDADQFHYMWQALGWYGSISAQVLTQQRTNGWAEAGVMIRQDATPSSPYYYVALTPDHGIVVHYRSAAGVDARKTGPHVAPGVHVFLCAVRLGNVYGAFTSTDGVAWVLVPQSTVWIDMQSTVLAGLAVTAHDTSAASMATFAAVTLLPRTPDAAISSTPPPPAPDTQDDSSGA